MNREWRFHHKRRYRFDFAWPYIMINEKRFDTKMAVEIEGGTWVNGAHTRGKHFESDCEKYNLATMHGWHILRYTSNMIKDGRAIKQIEEYFEKLKDGF